LSRLQPQARNEHVEKRRRPGSDTIPAVDATAIEATVRRVIDDYRSRSLWFLREDYYPATSVERERVLDLIVRHGDREALQRVAEVRRWLSHFSSDTSAAR
jgi:hypothetical protein